MGLAWVEVAEMRPDTIEWWQTDVLRETITGDSIRVIFETDYGFEPRYRLGHLWLRQVFFYPATAVTGARRLYPKPEPMLIRLDTPPEVEGTRWAAFRALQVKQGGRYPPFVPVRLRVQELREV